MLSVEAEEFLSAKCSKYPRISSVLTVFGFLFEYLSKLKSLVDLGEVVGVLDSLA